MINLILSQGRVADKTSRTIIGASRTANYLSKRYDLNITSIGEPTPPAIDDWTVSLPQAKETLFRLAEAVKESIRSGCLTLLASNTCPASIATLPIVVEELPDVVVLWIDAHSDFNTPETTESGYLGGMVVAAACGLWDSGHGAGLKANQLVMIGTRDIDMAERALLNQEGVRVIPPVESTPENILNAINGARVWIHIDWDALEPGYVPADYQVKDGLMPTQLRDILEAIPIEQILGIELAEFNAPLDDAYSDKALSVIHDIVSPVLNATC